MIGTRVQVDAVCAAGDNFLYENVRQLGCQRALFGTGEKPVEVTSIVLSVVTVQIWWAFWDLHQVEEWTAYGFVTILCFPVLIYLATAILMPQRQAVDTDWREYFVAQRRDFLVLLAIFTIASMLLSWVLLDLPLSHPYRLWQASMALLVLSGIFLTGERYHHWLPWIFLAVLIASQVLFRSRPGAFLAT